PANGRAWGRGTTRRRSRVQGPGGGGSMDAIEAVAFDLYGTLLEVASVGRAAAEVTGEPAALVELWRQKQLEYTWLRTLMGRYQNFWATTADALDYALDRLAVVVDEAARARLLHAWL